MYLLRYDMKNKQKISPSSVDNTETTTVRMLSSLPQTLFVPISGGDVSPPRSCPEKVISLSSHTSEFLGILWGALIGLEVQNM